MSCGCNKSTCNKCFPLTACCANVSLATPLVPCGTVPVTSECQVLINQQFFTALKINNSWNVPACGDTATLSVTGLKVVLVGSYLWNPTYGYFEIVSFDVDTQLISVRNNCNDGNAVVGSVVPACTLFVVVDAPLGASSGTPSIFPYVAVDFTAPNNGDCLLITVTNVNGLAVGKDVQIGDGTYLLNSIPDGTHIEICNEGDGITPGTSVFAKNSSNQFQYPIVLIDSNPCTNDPVDNGCIVVCKDNIMQPLGATGLLAGMVPMLTDDDSCNAAYTFLNVPTRTCSTLLCCLTLLNGNAGPYTIRVADSSQFTIGDILQIGTRTDRFTVTNIIDSTHIQATVSPVPVGNQDIDAGTSICIVDCCEMIQNEIDSEEFRCSDFQNRVAKDTDTVRSVNAILTIDAITDTAVSDVGILSVTNGSSCRVLWLLIIIETFAFGNSNGAHTDELSVELQTGFSLTTNPPPAVLGGAVAVYPIKDADTQYTFKQVYHQIVGPVLPGNTVNLVHQAKLIAKVAVGSAAFKIDPEALTSRIFAFGVAL